MIKSRIINLAGHVKYTGEGRVTFKVFVGKCEVKKHTRRPRFRWVQQRCIKIYLKGMGWAGLDGINLAQNRNSVIEFPKMRRIFSIAEELLLSVKGHCYMQLVIATLFFAVSD
jgi:hypothetical protein